MNQSNEVYPPVTNYSKHQQNIIKNYYENRDAIALQRVQELVTELYLSEGKKRQRYWEQVKLHLAKLGLKQAADRSGGGPGQAGTRGGDGAETHGQGIERPGGWMTNSTDDGECERRSGCRASRASERARRIAGPRARWTPDRD